MRANVPHRITNKQKAAIRKEVAEEMVRQSKDSTRRIFKLWCAALHEEYGFGKVRLRRILQRVSEVAEIHAHDEVYWTHVDMLMDQLGLAFEKENYAEVER